MKIALSLLLLLVLVAACTFTAHSRTWDPETGKQLTDEFVNIKLGDVSVRTPKIAVSIGFGVTDNIRFEMFDSNGDGKPDLAKDPTSGKMYEIKEIVPVPSGGRLRDLPIVLHRNDPSVPLTNNPPYCAEKLHDQFGFDDLSEDTNGETYMRNRVIVYDVTPGLSPLDTIVRIGVRTSTDIGFARLQDFPDLRYELLNSMPEDSAMPTFLVAHVEGPWWRIALWMAASGTKRFWYRGLGSDPADALGFEVVGDNGEKITFFVGTNSVLTINR
jgi:hypothetical protein